MKRLAIALCIIVLLVIFSPGFSILAQSTHTPHENPATAKSSSDPAALLLSYSKTFDLIAISQYQDAQSMLDKIKYANIPDGVRDIIDHYNTLCQQLLTTLNKMEYLLDETSTLFSHNQISDAKEKLDDAETTIRDAQFLLKDIEAVTNTLADNLDVLAALADSQIRQAYERQQANLSRLRQLINELNQLRESLSLNPLMVIRTSFYHPTLLEVSVPETAYPGLPITISGQVSSTGGNIDRAIKIVLDDIQLAEAMIRGQFSLEVTPPQQISTGRHTLTVVATPEGRFAGTSKSLPINIEIPIWTEIYVPRLITIPETIRISGKVYHGLGPTQDAWIKITFKDFSTTVKTDTNGSFTTSLNVPLDLSLIGPQELTITIEPVEPWYASLQIKRRIFAVNPAHMGLMLVVLLSLGLLVYNRVRTRVPVPQEEKVILQPQVKEPSAVTPPSRPKYEFTDIRGRILSAYTIGLETVEKMTSISMAAHTTLREFLKTVTPQLSTAIKPFTELTTIAEVALYSAHKPDKDIVARAEHLAATIKEELHSEAA